MLYNLCAFALLLAQIVLSDVDTESEASYFVGKFQGLYPWAYPVNMCVPSGLLYPYVKFECSDDGEDGWIVTEHVYTSADKTCSTTPKSSTIFYNTSKLEKGLYAFNCDGTTDYLATKLFVGDCTSATTAIVYSAINTCFKVSHTNYTYDYFEQTQCNASTAIVSKYAASGLTDTCDVDFAELETQSYISTTCAYYLSSGGEEVYAQLHDCVYNNYSQLAETQNNSDWFKNSHTTLQTISLSADLWPVNDSLTDPDLCGQDWFDFFTEVFNGSYVSVTSQCLSDEGEYDYYSGVYISIYVEVYGEYYVPSCTYLTQDLGEILTLLGLTNFNSSNVICSEYNVTTAPTTTAAATSATTKASASMNTFSLIVFAVSFLATISMYIL